MSRRNVNSRGALRGLCLFLTLVVSLTHGSVAAFGAEGPGAYGISETTAQIMMRAAASANAPAPIRPPGSKIEPDRTKLPMDPASPRVAEWPPRPASASTPVPMAPAQTPTFAFTAATMFVDSTFKPPDSMGAVGPTEFLTVINGRVKSATKQTGATGALDTDLQNFFAATRNSSSAFDPRVRFDRLTGRWFLVAVNGALAPPNRVLIAVSDGPTISASTVWTQFFFQQDQAPPTGQETCWGDYPTLGIDANALYVGINLYCPNNYAGSAMFVVRKSSLLGGGPLVVTAFRDLVADAGGAFAPVGADNDDPTATVGYIIGVDLHFSGRLTLRRITDPGGAPAISNNIAVTVPTTRSPINVPQSGSTAELHGGDGRLINAVIRNGRLWTTHTSGVDNTGTTSGTITRNAARWYELDNLDAATPTVTQAGTLYGSTPSNTPDARQYFYASLAVSGQGHMALGASSAGATEFANAIAAGRLADDPAGTLRAPVQLTASNTAYSRPDSLGRSRWGDYSLTSVDPVDNMTMWTIQEYCSDVDIWSLRVVKLQAPPPANPTGASPATVPAGSSSVNIVISGSSTSGSGFYDPGPAFTARLSASVTGGVVVRSVNVTSPTSVTLNVSTTAATNGPKNVTIVNPDGQSVTVTALFTVTGTTGDTTAPTVSVIAPNGGEVLHSATPYTVAWSGSDNIGVSTYDVQFASDGVTFVGVPGCSGLSGSATSCVWNAPGPVTTQGRVRVLARDAAGNVGSDQSNAAVQVATGAALITVKIPNTKKLNWGIGGTQAITWTHNIGVGSLMNIAVSRDGGGSWSTIANGVANSSATAGSYAWTVTGPPSAAARIRVSAANMATTDASNASFTIAQPLITLTAPIAASENWGYGTRQKVTWTSNLGPTDMVQLRLSTDGGASFPTPLGNPIVVTKNTATVTIPVFGAAADARVRVQMVTNGAVQGTSPVSFHTAPPFVTVVLPNGAGDTWHVGQQGVVTWQHNLGLLESVKIDLSTNGGASYPIALSKGTKSDGTESFTVAAGWVTSNARVRVTWKGKASVNDPSDQSFIVQ